MASCAPRPANQTHRYFVDGGFAQVRDDVVTVLTHRAIPAAQIDATAAARQLEAVGEHSEVTDADFAEHTKSVARAAA